ncbi:hypothetical protein [Vibrio sp. PNB22_4_2]
MISQEVYERIADFIKEEMVNNFTQYRHIKGTVEKALDNGYSKKGYDNDELESIFTSYFNGVKLNKSKSKLPSADVINMLGFAMPDVPWKHAILFEIIEEIFGCLADESVFKPPFNIKEIEDRAAYIFLINCFIYMDDIQELIERKERKEEEEQQQKEWQEQYDRDKDDYESDIFQIIERDGVSREEAERVLKNLPIEIRKKIKDTLERNRKKGI